MSLSASPAVFIMARNGISLIEVVLALAIVSVAVTVFIGGILYGSDAVVSRYLRVQARWHATECLHVARWLRNIDGLDGLTVGNHGLVVTGGRWELFGTEDTNGPFERMLTVSDVGEHERGIQCTVTWESQFGEREVVLESRVAAWNE